MQPHKSSPIRRSETDNDFALAMCRESRRVSPGRLHTESELAGNQAAAIMTSVSVFIEFNVCLEYDKVESWRIERKTRENEAQQACCRTGHIVF